MKLLLENLNPDLYPSHSTNIYICGVTIAPRVHSGTLKIIELG